MHSRLIFHVDSASQLNRQDLDRIPTLSLVSSIIFVTMVSPCFFSSYFSSFCGCNVTNHLFFFFSLQAWKGVRQANKFAPVCPQILPDLSNKTEALLYMTVGRFEYLKKLLPYLRDQSEDCLYLNIYAPLQDNGTYNSFSTYSVVNYKEKPINSPLLIFVPQCEHHPRPRY